MKHIFIVSALMLCVSVCNGQSSSKDSVQNVMLDTITVTAPPGPPEYRASAPRGWDIKNTRIAVSFNWKERTANVREWIKLRPYFYATDTLVMDAKSMRIDSVMLVGKKGNAVLDFTYEKESLKIRFGQTFKMTDSIELYLK